MRSRLLQLDQRTVILGAIASLAAYYLLPWPALSWIVLLGLAVLAWLRLDVVLALLPLTFPFWFVPKRVTPHAVFPLSEIVLVLCCAVALAQVLGSLIHHSRSPDVATRLRGVWTTGSWPLWIGAGAFLVAGTLGVLVARQPREALREWRWEVVEPLVYLLLLLAYRHVRSLWRLTVGAFLASAAVLALLAAAQMLVWHVTYTPLASGSALAPLVPGPDGAIRATGLVYGSGNSLGAYLERALPLAAVFAVLPTGQTGASSRARVACAGLSLAYVLALLWSGSRGAWAGAAAGLAVLGAAWLWRYWASVRLTRNARVPVGIGATVAVCLVAVIALVWGRRLVSAALAGHNGSGEMRALLWLAAWHMIRDHPFLGIGLDQFLYYYSNLYTSHPYWITTLNGQPTIAWREPTLSHPHNLVLDLWLSVGLLGLVAVVVVLAWFFRTCVRLWLDRSTLPASPSGEGVAVLALGAGAAMLAGVVHGMVDSAYFEPDLALIFWWLIAVVLLAQEQAPRASRTEEAAALEVEGSGSAESA